MRAADGAIEGVKLARRARFELTVIGDVAPVGLCGSGLVDAVAELVGAGIIDPSGRFVLGSHERLGKIGEENVFYLTDDVYLSQRDVRELQFAKASIATGWAILCRDLGIAPEDISQVLLAGSFGSYLSAASAVRIGLVPKLPLMRIVSAGNVAGEGAKIAALSVTERAAAQAVLEEVAYVELSGRADFNDLFIDQLASRMKRVVVACGALALHVDAIADRRGLGPRGARRCRPSSTTGPSGSRAAAEAAVGDDDASSPTPTAARAARSTASAARRRPLLRAVRRRASKHAARAGTYYLTDFLVRCFDRVVVRGLGLDRYPELRDDYFRNYERVVWLAQKSDPRTAHGGRARSGDLGLPLEVRETGETGSRPHSKSFIDLQEATC